MNIILKNRRVFTIEDENISLEEYIDIAQKLKGFEDGNSNFEMSRTPSNVAPLNFKNIKPNPITKPYKPVQYLEGERVRTGKAMIRGKGKWKIRHRWGSREKAVQAIKIHYLGNIDQKLKFAEEEGLDWIELSKSFSAIIKRYGITPKEIGVPKFGKTTWSYVNERKSKGKAKKERINAEETEELAKKVYDMRQGGMDFSDIRKKLEISNNDARKLFKKYYNRIYMRQYIKDYREEAKKKEENLEGKEYEDEDVQKATQEFSRAVQEFDRTENMLPKVDIAENEFLRFFNDINNRSPEHIEKGILLLRDFLKSNGGSGNSQEIIDYLNQRFEGLTTTTIHPEDIKRWIGE
jgi:hypothetical protein